MSDAITPTGIDLQDSKSVFRVTWQDGAETRIAYRDLRLACGCALCVEEMTGKPLLDPGSVPEGVGVEDCKEVGLYGVQIWWSDGHSTGIYTWERIRRLGAAPDRTAQ